MPGLIDAHVHLTIPGLVVVRKSQLGPWGAVALTLLICIIVILDFRIACPPF